MTDLPPLESPATVVPPLESPATVATDATTGTIAKPLTPQRCLFGSVIAGVLAYGMYRMTQAIAQSFALHKVTSDNLIVQRISAAVRTLVVGMTTLGMGVFGLAAIGLMALAVQIILQKRSQPPSDA
ncbi:MAG: DUF3082 domain-containing protein [Leptolyngbyaceae cyanobacterium bins.349]|nr:DUF3082 domain-containing protein [Leptolyngbyaceae cyanobacterium bins.349]